VELNDIIKNELVQEAGIFYLKNHRPFDYSDGVEIENYIHRAIDNSVDISSNSRELEQKIKDWPSLYHLSRARSIVYNSLSLPPDASVLEVGSGCGAITRFLGERVAGVVALEGSPRRAAITRARTRDLDSVAVLCASFEDVVFDGSFDFVICNGVLEYAPLFIKHDRPVQELIRSLTSLLAPSGNLIVAIENKFGLRYFSSGKEEHTNRMFDGIEGYARFPNGPKTFGFSELHAMLSEHCTFVETFLPLPDYKLPTALIRAELPDEVNCAELFESAARHDYGSYEEPRMHERLVWQELQKNRLLKIFANSFFMVAGNEKISLFGDGWMGDIYSIKRNADLTVRTTIVKRESGGIRTIKSYFECGGKATNIRNLNHVLCESAWIDGISIHTLLARAMLRGENDLSLEDRIREPVIAWWDAIAKLGLKDGTLPGEAFDCIWHNSIMNDGKVYFIDKEWISNSRTETISIIYRSVAIFAAQERHYRHRWNRSCRNSSEMKLMKAVANVLGIKMTCDSIFSAIKRHLEIHESIDGMSPDKLKRLSRSYKIFLRLYIPFNILTVKNDLARDAYKICNKLNSLLKRISRLATRMVDRDDALRAR
jgi:SAM-dependent methyltransferase